MFSSQRMLNLSKLRNAAVIGKGAEKARKSPEVSLSDGSEPALCLVAQDFQT
jgi:hypothetical protein